MSKQDTFEQKQLDAEELIKLLDKLPYTERQKFLWMVKGAAVVAEQAEPKPA